MLPLQDADSCMALCKLTSFWGKTQGGCAPPPWRAGTYCRSAHVSRIAKPPFHRPWIGVRMRKRPSSCLYQSVSNSFTSLPTLRFRLQSPPFVVSTACVHIEVISPGHAHRSLPQPLWNDEKLYCISGMFHTTAMQEALGDLLQQGETLLIRQPAIVCHSDKHGLHYHLQVRPPWKSAKCVLEVCVAPLIG
jgi:hypothetical protein